MKDMRKGPDALRLAPQNLLVKSHPSNGLLDIRLPKPQKNQQIRS